MSRDTSGLFQSSYGSTAGSDHEQMIFSGESRDLRVLCEAISTNIYSINSSAKNLQGALSTLGTTNDTPSYRDKIHVWQSSANQLIKSTTQDVRNLARLSRSVNKLQKLQADKITGHFQEAVKSCTDAQMAVADKLRKTLPKQPAFEESNENTSLLEDERQQLQIQTQLQFETEMLAEREQRFLEIESDVREMNQLMKELGAIVHEQGAAVDSIENNIEDAMGQVTSAAGELAQAEVRQNKSRKRKLILLAILVIIVAILIGVIVWSARS